MGERPLFVWILIVLLGGYVLWLLLSSYSARGGGIVYHHHHHAPRPRSRPPPTCDGDDEDLRGNDPQPEPFEVDPTPAGGAGASADPAIAPRPAYNLQDAIDFSDVTVSTRERQEWADHVESAKQIQTVNQRFDAAKRRTEEHKLKPGVYTNKKRRELVEAMVRRPYCGRRARAWRTAFSDTMRGDVVPKNLDNGSMGMMRIGRMDPSVDLHPGALGPLSGLSGAWVSEENIPENVFEDQMAYDG